MGKFVKHSPCPRCGSRDNLATYHDGSGYCFGCGFVIKSRVSPYVTEENGQGTRESNLLAEKMPGDDCVQYGLSAQAWARSFDVKVEELLARRVSYSPSQDRLFFNFYDAEGNRIFSQARNFSPLAKSKYWTVGKADDVLPIYYSTRIEEAKIQDGISKTRELVITEDCLSAIKIARQSDAMPALSSDLSLTKLKRLARLYGAFLVWLDGDMFHKSQRICRRLQLLGCEAKPIYTPLDPKCYDDETIRNVLLTGKL